MKPSNYPKIGAFVKNAIEKEIQTTLRERKPGSSRELKTDLPSMVEVAGNFESGLGSELFFSEFWETDNVKTRGNLFMNREIVKLETQITAKGMIIEGLEYSLKRLQNIHTEMLRRQHS